MKGNKPAVDNLVLLVLQAVEELPLQDALRTLQRIVEMLNATEIAAQTGEALARPVRLHNLEDTPAFDPVLKALLDAEPDCQAAAGIGCGAENKTETDRAVNGERTVT